LGVLEARLDPRHRARDASGASALSTGSNREETRTGTARENLIKTRLQPA
jgi:hypothetical protein